MFTEKDLRELVGHQSKTSMMSIYLNTDPAEGNADSYRLRLRNMLKTTDLSDDIARIELFFETEYDWSGKSVAVFSDVTEDFFRVFPLAVPVKDLVNVGIRPNVRPLAGLLDSFGGYGVVLLDKQGARLFHFHLGELYEQEGVLGELIKQVKPVVLLSGCAVGDYMRLISIRQLKKICVRQLHSVLNSLKIITLKNFIERYG